MKVEIAGFTASKHRENLVLKACNRRLLSYFFIKEDLKSKDKKGSCQYYSLRRMIKMKIKRRKRFQKPEVFIDSGAFSAFTQNIDIDIYDYIAFIKKYLKYIDYYAVLDSIGDPKQTLINQNIMEEEGLTPIPCFHYGENIAFLKHYIKRGHSIIALGGMVPISTTSLRPWLDNLFSNYLCGKDGMPLVRVHGFGMTAFPLMTRYPWYSVDSTSWVATSRFGGVLVPKISSSNVYNYQKPMKLDVSTRPNPKGLTEGQHINSLTAMERNLILRYFEAKGYPFGKSKFIEADKDEQLGDNEKWVTKARNGIRVKEIIIEPGLTNDYHYRDLINIDYFLELEKSIPAYPWPFKLKKRGRLFG